MFALLRLSLLCCLAVCAFAAPEVKSLVPPPTGLPTTKVDVCRMCKGSGTAEREARGVRIVKGLTLQMPCPACKGKGMCPRLLNAAEKLDFWRTRHQAYVHAQLAAGLVPIASAYADRAELAALSPEDYARLAHTYPATCKSCQGLKFTLCRRCKGEGQTAPKRPKPGEAVVFATPCDACKGTGEEFCRACKGEGLRPLCSRCSGTGVVDGRPKKGEEPFTERCRSCKGEGRR